ncbi:hypothetical protein GQ43DRAFT_483181 [Delitschia confertaspora ATCC 74209]|uniref:Polynucleotide 5'-hydroxyl-kinase GRC3 n=1 Tax=Delitschia confertaspora ATCC 74209 TaxID=1513339 RepID=A0A9P4JHW7_9PLEO|nr:hypothetical protein GQ43DRAFT_483181 [Delitschia confertaspora ATCC 74209]
MPDSSGSAKKPMSALAAARARHMRPVSAATAAKSTVELRTVSVKVDPASEDEYISERSASPTPEPVVSVALCTWRQSDESIVSSSQNESIIKLNQYETITHIGTYDFQVIEGRVSIEGTTALPSEESFYRVHAPTTHHICKIKGLAKTNTVRFLHVEDRGVRQFADLSPLYRRIWNAEFTDKPPRSFARILSTTDDPLSRTLIPELHSHEYQAQVDDAVTNSKCVFVCGAKSSGKSTFARRLVNAYLTGPSTSTQAKPGRSVLYLDLDPSLPEYTPHGQVSLVLVKEPNLGPSFTHPAPIPSTRKDVNELIIAHPFPYKEISQRTTYYISCIRSLFQTAQDLQPKDGRSLPVPIVINTPAWTSFGGTDLLISLITLLKPSRVIYLEGGKAADGTESFLDDEDKEKFQKACLRDHGPRTSLRLLPKLFDTTQHRSHSDADLRSMTTLSYFHSTSLPSFASPSNSPSPTYNSLPLSFTVPWKLKYDPSNGRVGCAKIVMLENPFSAGPPMETVRATPNILNTSLVQIVEETEQSFLVDAPYYLPRTTLPEPATSKLLFTALVRSYRPEEKELLLLIPETHAEIAEKTKWQNIVVVHGCCDYPDWALLEDPNWDYAQRVKEVQNAFPVESADEQDTRMSKRVKKTKNGDVDMRDATDGRRESSRYAQEELDPRVIAASVDLPPYVTTEEKMAPFRHLNVLRRTRKFHQE